MRAAVDALLSFHSYDVVETLPVAAGVEYTIPRYDLDAFLIEAELLLDWYLPRFGANIADTARATFVGALARGADAGAQREADLGVARLSFAQSVVAAGPRGNASRSAFSISRMR